jgi:hypothetical protein
LGEFDLGDGVEGVAGVPEGVGLFIDGPDEGGVAVAEEGAAKAGEEVEVLFAVAVREARAVAFGHDDGEAGVVADEEILALLEEVGGVFGH